MQPIPIIDLSAPWAIAAEKLPYLVDASRAIASGTEPPAAAVSALAGRPGPRESQAYQLVGDVAIVPLFGPLFHASNMLTEWGLGTATPSFIAAVRSAAADKAVGRIVLDVDSPGGEAMGTAEAAAAVREVAALKPVTACITGYGASAAYYIAAAAGEVVAGASAQVGSIGTAVVHLETSRRNLAEGLTYTVVSAGEHKADAGPLTPLDAQGRETIQRTVDAYYAQFTGDVARFRGVPLATVLKQFGQGRTFLGAEAVERGLADRVGTLEQVVFGSPSASPAVAGAALSVLEGVHVMAKETIPATPAPIAPVAAGPAIPDPGPTAETLRAAGIQAERERAQDIRERGRTLGVEASMIDAAIDNGLSVDQFLRQATNYLAQVNRPVVPVPAGGIYGSEAAVEKFSDQAVAALAYRAGFQSARNLDPTRNHLAHYSLLRIAEECVRMNNRRTVLGSPEEIITAALSADGGLRVTMGDGSVNSPGSFPGILGALANRTLAEPLEFSPSTFASWAYRLPPVNDFRPSTIWQLGEFGELPEHIDGHDFEESTTFEEGGWIQAGSFGDEFRLTPVMIQNDDLGAFTLAVQDKHVAHDQTLNRLCVNLLAGNPVLWTDNVPLFNAAHGNLIDVGSGGAPSDTELSDMRELLRAQVGISGKRMLGFPLVLILVPSKLETTTEKLLKATLNVVPTSTTNANPFRGSTDYRIEPMLDEVSDKVWYGFGPVGMARCICYTYMSGYERMVIRRYFNPKNNCLHFQVEGRFAAAARSHRGVAKNAGE